MDTPYAYEVFYTKTFVSGNLNGLSVPCSVRFPSRSRAIEFSRGLDKGADCITQAGWLASKVKVERIPS